MHMFARCPLEEVFWRPIHGPAVPSPWEGSMRAYEPNDPKYIMEEPTLRGMLAQVFSFPQLLAPLTIGEPTSHGKTSQGFLTFHHVLLVVTVVVTVCGSVIDIKAMDWGVVVTCWDILQGIKKKQVDNGAEKSSCEQNHWWMEILPSLEFTGDPDRHF